MAKVCKDIASLMPDLTCTEDEGTLAFFKTLLGKKVSNIEAKIKKSCNFAEAQNFLDSIGMEALKVAMEEFRDRCTKKGRTYERNSDGAHEFLLNFLKEMNIELWYSFGA